MRDSQKMAVIGGIAAVVVGATGAGVYALTGSGDEETASGSKERVTASGEGESPQGGVETGPPSDSEITGTAKKFLKSWESGDAAGAARLTSERAEARKALAGLRTDAGVARLSLQPSAASGGKVPFAVSAQIKYGTENSSLSYTSSLEVVRDKQTGKPVVDWKPSVVHPKLQEGQSIKTDRSGTPPIKAVDRNGTEITKADHPDLGSILDDLRRRYGDKTDGTAGVETRIVDAKGEDTGDTLRVLSRGTPGTLKTTLDLNMQKSAEKAISKKKKASVVAVKPSTGEIMAVANTPSQGFNHAVRGSLAPGSTMKVVSGAMLLDKGLASPNKPHPCPKYSTYGGWKFQNDKKFQIKNGTFAQSFARSCNTAFITQAKKLKDDDLTKEAREVFGLGLDWQVGTGTFDGGVPVQSDAQMAASLIGQGGVRMNALTMASVSATVQAGEFKQPVIVPQSLDDRKLAEAPRKMKATANQDLRSLMKTTATSGTAAEALAGLSGDVGGKTGSAEVDNQKKPNGWFTAYRDDMAAAAVVPASGHGGSNAGPVVHDVLAASKG